MLFHLQGLTSVLNGELLPMAYTLQNCNQIHGNVLQKTLTNKTNRHQKQYKAHPL